MSKEKSQPNVHVEFREYTYQIGSTQRTERVLLVKMLGSIGATEMAAVVEAAERAQKQEGRKITLLFDLGQQEPADHFKLLAENAEHKFRQRLIQSIDHFIAIAPEIHGFEILVAKALLGLHDILSVVKTESSVQLHRKSTHLNPVVRSYLSGERTNNAESHVQPASFTIIELLASQE